MLEQVDEIQFPGGIVLRRITRLVAPSPAAFVPVNRAGEIAALAWAFLAHEQAVGQGVTGPSWEERHVARWREIECLQAEGRHDEAERLINAECGR
jgi:hypothetical protein